MGDLEEVMAIGKKLNMNPLEQSKYKVHIDKIRYNEQKAKGWKTINFFWQMIFFGTLFIEAIAILFLHIADAGYLEKDMGDTISTFIRSWFFLLFGFLMPFSFPLMMWTGVVRGRWEMWTGVVRGRWEGALTRSTAYALSFLENIEHRMYLEEKLQVRPQKMLKTPAPTVRR
jgi:hypothetical protein